jgi:D-arabinose 1-dehydrogenase-like Zn-dependent alcohol dehydrogenase
MTSTCWHTRALLSFNDRAASSEARALHMCACCFQVFSRSYNKKDMAMEQLGADDFVATSDVEAVKRMSEKLDAIIDTVAMPHDLNQLLGMLKVDGQLICVGAPSTPKHIW